VSRRVQRLRAVEISQPSGSAAGVQVRRQGAR
jgi:hypothetical protein